MLLVIISFVFIGGCSKKQPEADNGGRVLLENGYAQLYDLTQALSSADSILKFKEESDGFDKLVSELSNVEAAMAKYIESLAKGDSAYDLENTGEAEITKRAMKSSQTDRLLSYSPFFGRTDDNFERTYLLGLTGALNHQFHLVKVMKDLERDAERNTMLSEFQDDTNAFYDEVINRLNKRHFRKNIAEPSLEEGA